MNAFYSSVCDPVYTNHSAPGAISVDDHCYLDQVPMDGLLQQEQQRMWLGGFMNVEMDPTRSSFIPSSSVYLGDSSNLPYHSRCNGSPAALPMVDGQVSEIQVHAQVYNNNVNANGSFGAEYHPYTAAFPGPSIQVNANLAPPQFPNANNYNNVIYGTDSGTASPPIAENFAPPPYTQYLIDGNDVYGQEQQAGVTSDYSTLSPNMVASLSEKHDYRALTPAAHVVLDNTTALAENGAVLPVAVEANERASRSGSAGKATKSNKKPGKDGNLGWIHCTPVAVTNSRNPDSPPTYRVVSRLMVRKKPSEAKSTSKRQKRPRVAVVVTGADGEEKVLHFRSCVVKYFDLCKWDGCQDVVWTDRKSIREHMETAHGVYWNPDDKITCRWESCKSGLSIDSLFRHITNTHMKVIRASCVYGCGEDYSRIDGRNCHSPKCSLRPTVA